MNQEKNGLEKLKEFISKINRKHLIASGGAATALLGVLIFQNGMCDSGVVTAPASTATTGSSPGSTSSSTTLTLVITPSTVSPGGTATLSATGGSGNYTYTVPAGSQGTITGSTYTAPSTNGPYQIQVTDSSNSSAVGYGVVTVGTNIVVTLNPASSIPPGGTVTLGANGGVAPYTFAIVNGGVGSISQSNGTWIFTSPPAITANTVSYVQATDSKGNSSGNVPINTTVTTGGVIPGINSPFPNDRVFGKKIPFGATASINALTDPGDTIASYTYVLSTASQPLSTGGVWSQTNQTSNSSDTYTFDSTQGATPNGAYTLNVIVTTKNGHQGTKAIPITIANMNPTVATQSPTYSGGNNDQPFCDGAQAGGIGCATPNVGPSPGPASNYNLVGLSVCYYNSGYQQRLSGLAPVYQPAFGPQLSANLQGYWFGGYTGSPTTPNSGQNGKSATAGNQGTQGGWSVACQLLSCASSGNQNFRMTGITVGTGGAWDTTSAQPVVTALEITCADPTGQSQNVWVSNSVGCTNGQPSPSWTIPTTSCSQWGPSGNNSGVVTNVISCPSVNTPNGPIQTFAAGIFGWSSPENLDAIGLVCQ